MKASQKIMTYAAGVSYDGTMFHGSQIQLGFRTVVGEIIEAFAKITQYSIWPTFSGRTDRGVHAFEQVMSFQAPYDRDIHHWQTGLNHHLPHDIKILWVLEVSEDFHARYSAYARTYIYKILIDRTLNVFDVNKVWKVPLEFNTHHAIQASKIFIGNQNLSNYISTPAQCSNPQRKIYHCAFYRHGNYGYFFITADGFFYHLVRMIVSDIVQYACNNLSLNFLYQRLNGKNIWSSQNVAPPHGLYFLKVYYKKTNFPKKYYANLPIKFRININTL